MSNPAVNALFQNRLLNLRGLRLDLRITSGASNTIAPLALCNQMHYLLSSPHRTQNKK